MNVFKMQIYIAMLPQTLFPRHTSDNAMQVRHDVTSFCVLKTTVKDKKLFLNSKLRASNKVNEIAPELIASELDGVTAGSLCDRGLRPSPQPLSTLLPTTEGYVCDQRNRQRCRPPHDACYFSSALCGPQCEGFAGVTPSGRK